MTGDEQAAPTIERRLDALEEWRAAQEALSAVRRWALPIALSVIGAVTTLVNILLFILRR